MNAASRGKEIGSLASLAENIRTARISAVSKARAEIIDRVMGRQARETSAVADDGVPSK